jgi:hypothetical protein
MMLREERPRAGGPGAFALPRALSPGCFATGGGEGTGASLRLQRSCSLKTCPVSSARGRIFSLRRWAYLSSSGCAQQLAPGYVGEPGWGALRGSQLGPDELDRSTLAIAGVALDTLSSEMQTEHSATPPDPAA